MKKIVFIILFLSWALLSACTIGVASGSVTTDGRPLIWKTRDRESRQNNRVFYNTDFPYKFISVVDSGATFSWMGVNEHGFAILNSASYDLIETRDLGNGGFMRYALGNAKNITEFENLLQETNTAGRVTYANFAVLDSTGMASMFEVSANEYWRFDAEDDENGWIVRANFALNGGGNSGLDRFNRAQENITNLAENNQLNHFNLFQHQIRDFSDENSEAIEEPLTAQYALGLPYGFFNTEYSINSYQSVSAAVIRGILPSESPLLTTMFAILGNPSTAIAVPYLPVGITPSASYNDSIPPLTQIANSIKSELFRSTKFIDSYLIFGDNNNGLLADFKAFENNLLVEFETFIEDWRNNGFTDTEILNYQEIAADSALVFLQNYQIENDVVADFSYEMTAEIDGATVQFFDNSLHAPTNWMWDFNEDGLIDSEEQNPTYTFAGEGDYTVTLYVFDEQSEDVITKENFVEVCTLGNSDINLPFRMMHPYPNPFNPNTTISFFLENHSKVLLDIYNIRGQSVKNIYQGNLDSGWHSYVWEGKDKNNENVSSGVYFVSLWANNYNQKKKVILLK